MTKATDRSLIIVIIIVPLYMHSKLAKTVFTV